MAATSASPPRAGQRLSDSVRRQELLDACSWVAPDKQVHVANEKTTDSALSARELGLYKKTERSALYFLLKSAILPLLPPLISSLLQGSRVFPGFNYLGPLKN